MYRLPANGSLLLLALISRYKDPGRNDCYRFALLFTFMFTIRSECPRGWVYSSPRCYKFVDDEPLIYEEADAACWVSLCNLPQLILRLTTRIKSNQQRERERERERESEREGLCCVSFFDNVLYKCL